MKNARFFLNQMLLGRLKHHWWDVLAMVLLWICLAVMLFFYWGRQGSVLVDAGKEAYLAQAVLRGELLYQDLFNLYGPFSHQMNALVLAAFPDTLDTMQGIAAVLMALLLVGLYAIARVFESRWSSVLLVFCFLLTSMFTEHMTAAYLLPYGYAMLYGVSFGALGMACLLWGLRLRQTGWLISAAFCLSVAITNKLDFALFFLPLLVGMCLLKPKQWQILKIVLALCSVPALTFGILAAQGVQWSDLWGHWEFLQTYLRSPYYKAISLNFGTQWHPELAYSAGWLLASTLFVLTPLLAVMHWALRQFIDVSQCWPFGAQGLLKLVGAVVLAGMALVLLLPHALALYDSGYMFRFLPQTTLLLTCVLGWRLYHRGRQPAENQLSEGACAELRNTPERFDSTGAWQTSAFWVLMISALCLGARCFFLLNIANYGAFFLTLPFLAHIIFLIQGPPILFRSILPRLWRLSVVLMLVLLSVHHGVMTAQRVGDAYTSRVVTDKGTLYAKGDLGWTFQQAYDYLKSRVQPGEHLWVIPEGAMLNFLLDRPTHGLYWLLLPLHLEVFGERNVIHELKTSPPEWIVLNNRSSAEVGAGYFGQDYGREIDAYIKSHYDLQAEFGQDFKMWVYHLKPPAEPNSRMPSS